MFLEKSSVFKQFSHRKIPVRQADRDRPDIYFDKVEFTLSFDLIYPMIIEILIVKVNSGRSITKAEVTLANPYAEVTLANFTSLTYFML